ncbi:MarR family winged helix-turn-helix transcriptional regulator [Ideonella margarita]|uniref:MarR family winged helix-turn-helix transcriptional regulator n=1 Tax=Ideonella margarita TaxID=2984191 RepID=A0ABU9C8M7_9BURK
MPRKAHSSSPDQTPRGHLAEPELHNILGYQLAQATVVTNHIFKRLVATPESLSKVEFSLLSLVRSNPDVSAKQLSQALAMTPPNIAMWLDKLEARGWVARTRSTQDARVQLLRLTDEGQAAVARCVAALHTAEQEAIDTLSGAERAMLIELLHKVARARKAGR